MSNSRPQCFFFVRSFTRSVAYSPICNFLVNAGFTFRVSAAKASTTGIEPKAGASKPKRRVPLVLVDGKYLPIQKNKYTFFRDVCAEQTACQICGLAEIVNSEEQKKEHLWTCHKDTVRVLSTRKGFVSVKTFL